MKVLRAADIERAFSLMGEYLRDRKTFGEISVYGGSAILFQFDWRQGTQDVDAVITSDGNHGLVRKAADMAAGTLGLERSWLSEAVAQYARRGGDATALKLIGLYPKSGNPGLRVSAAKPEYLLAMKLAALQRMVADDRDFLDAQHIASDIGLRSRAELEAVYNSFFPDDPMPFRAGLRLDELAAALTSKKAD